MDKMGSYDDFVQRYQNVLAHHDASTDLIRASNSIPSSIPPSSLGSNANRHRPSSQDLLMREQRLHVQLEQLSGQLNDANLDISDATKSRRELQQRVRELEAQANFDPADHIYHLKVNTWLARVGRLELKLAESMPLCGHTDRWQRLNCKGSNPTVP